MDVAMGGGGNAPRGGHRGGGGGRGRGHTPRGAHSQSQRGTARPQRGGQSDLPMGGGRGQQRGGRQQQSQPNQPNQQSYQFGATDVRMGGGQQQQPQQQQQQQQQHFQQAPNGGGGGGMFNVGQKKKSGKQSKPPPQQQQPMGMQQSQLHQQQQQQQQQRRKSGAPDSARPRAGVKDFAMGSASRASTRGGGQQQAGNVWVEVSGFDPSQLHLPGLKKFLVKDTNPPILLGDEGELRGRKVLLRIISGDAKSLIRQRGGAMMGGNKLLIREFAMKDGSIGKQADQKLNDALNQVFHQCYLATEDPNVHVLNFDGRGGTAIGDGTVFNFNDVTFMQRFWQCLSVFVGAGGKATAGRPHGRRGRQQQQPSGVEGEQQSNVDIPMSFASCQIYTLVGFRAMKQHGFGKVSQLSLASNHIASVEELNHLRDGLTDSGYHLRDLVLIDNPFLQTLSADDYNLEIQRRFRKIAHIDTATVEPLISFGVPSMDAQLPDQFANIYDSELTQSTAEAFVRQFFSVYDSGDRNALQTLYMRDSCFSLVSTVGSRSQRRGRGRGSQPSQQQLGAEASGTEQLADVSSPYATHNRNLADHAKTSNEQVRLLRFGSANIISRFNDLPGTQHDDSSMIIDAVMANLPVREMDDGSIADQGSLVVHVHGSFTELPAVDVNTGQASADRTTQRSFTRSFVLFPAAESSAAHAEGWSVQVINDSLHVRDSAELPSNTFVPMLESPAIMNSDTPAAAHPTAGLNIGYDPSSLQMAGAPQYSQQ